MICICCNKEFEAKKRKGGQTRLMCYDCIPDNLGKKERNRRRRDCLRIASEALKEKTGCAKCGYNAYGAALDWHHIEPHTKEANPAKQLQTSWSAYILEVEKCILLCSNCHREYHYREREQGISITEFL